MGGQRLGGTREAGCGGRRPAGQARRREGGASRRQGIRRRGVWGGTATVSTASHLLRGRPEAILIELSLQRICVHHLPVVLDVDELGCDVDVDRPHADYRLEDCEDRRDLRGAAYVRHGEGGLANGTAPPGGHGRGEGGATVLLYCGVEALRRVEGVSWEARCLTGLGMAGSSQKRSGSATHPSLCRRRTLALTSLFSRPFTSSAASAL